MVLANSIIPFMRTLISIFYIYCTVVTHLLVRLMYVACYLVFILVHAETVNSIILSPTCPFANQIKEKADHNSFL